MKHCKTKQTGGARTSALLRRTALLLVLVMAASALFTGCGQLSALRDAQEQHLQDFLSENAGDPGNPENLFPTWEGSQSSGNPENFAPTQEGSEIPGSYDSIYRQKKANADVEVIRVDHESYYPYTAWTNCTLYSANTEVLKQDPSDEHLLVPVAVGEADVLMVTGTGSTAVVHVVVLDTAANVTANSVSAIPEEYTAAYQEGKLKAESSEIYEFAYIGDEYYYPQTAWSECLLYSSDTNVLAQDPEQPTLLRPVGTGEAYVLIVNSLGMTDVRHVVVLEGARP